MLSSGSDTAERTQGGGLTTRRNKSIRRQQSQSKDETVTFGTGEGENKGHIQTTITENTKRFVVNDDEAMFAKQMNLTSSPGRRKRGDRRQTIGAPDLNRQFSNLNEGEDLYEPYMGNVENQNGQMNKSMSKLQKSISYSNVSSPALYTSSIIRSGKKVTPGPGQTPATEATTGMKSSRYTQHNFMKKEGTVGGENGSRTYTIREFNTSNIH